MSLIPQVGGSLLATCRTSPSPFSMGIIGAGEIVVKHHLPVLTVFPDVTIEYVTDINETRLQDVASAYGLKILSLPEELQRLPITDGVLIAIPVGYRWPYYRLFAERGTAVYAEKPLTVSAQEGEDLCSIFPPHALVCGLQRRTYAAVDVARTAVMSGWFGPVRKVTIEEGARMRKTGTDAFFHDNWEAAQGGILRDLGCHSLDAMLQISGARSAEVLEARFVFDGAIDREVHATVGFLSPMGIFDVDFLVTWLRPTLNRMIIRFDSCALVISSRPDGEAGIWDANGLETLIRVDTNKRVARTSNQALYLAWEDFITAARSAKPGLLSASNYLPVLRIVDALYSASRRGS